MTKAITLTIGICLTFAGCSAGYYAVNARMGMTVEEFCDENIGEQLLEQEGNDYLYTLNSLAGAGDRRLIPTTHYYFYDGVLTRISQPKRSSAPRPRPIILLPPPR